MAMVATTAVTATIRTTTSFDSINKQGAKDTIKTENAHRQSSRVVCETQELKEILGQGQELNVNYANEFFQLLRLVYLEEECLNNYFFLTLIRDNSGETTTH